MTSDVVVRRADAHDAEELVRLRTVMMGSIDGTPPPLGEWSDVAVASLRRRLPRADASMAAFVVDRPAASGLAASGPVAPGPAGPGLAGPGLAGPGLVGPGLAGPGLAGPGLAGPGLAACAVGVFEERLGSPANPNGLAGYVFNVATDPQYRRRGFSTACMRALLDWFAANDVAVVNLRASDDGLPVYTRLGFELQPGPAMRLTLQAPTRSSAV
ncbi:GNAT family N-acetyltransferase [Dactylosporangium sp. AC04546]|uniref:GNAT family N-acetyltransferase n=1 Tax=Dactylosporangium sp. AC04546 TaxID=2862460 RepID=UPI002E7C2EAA|nr:GNAT family N-acetyltransferase [Dactylosporangium sp. AC04546]WVK85953.1 GNAT family N-acetyltransferase [Dactylosporangium sp. AC04546]